MPKKKPKQIVQLAINEAFCRAGNPIENLVVAALDNRSLRKSIGSPLKEACTALLQNCLQENPTGKRNAWKLKKRFVRSKTASRTIRLLLHDALQFAARLAEDEMVDWYLEQEGCDTTASSCRTMRVPRAGR